MSNVPAGSPVQAVRPGRGGGLPQREGSRASATIDLHAPLTIRNAFMFPLQTSNSRAEIVVGGVLLLLPFIGWLLNMGHRIEIVHAMQSGRQPWPAWHSWRRLLWHGTVTWLGMVCYYAPGVIALFLCIRLESAPVAAVAVLLFLLATLAIPGYMTHYCKQFDPREIFDPCLALRRSLEGGRMYWRAWAIALLALLLSFSGLLVFGVGFLLTSVWFWQVAGYSFANAFTHTPVPRNSP